MKSFKARITALLSRLSFRTGVITLCSAIPLYIASFAQLALPISASWKGVLWFTLFGLAKTAQYSGLAILGVEGIKRFKAWRQRASERFD